VPELVGSHGAAASRVARRHRPSTAALLTAQPPPAARWLHPSPSPQKTPQALNDSGLGAALIGGGIDDELKQPIFSVGLKVRAAPQNPRQPAAARPGAHALPPAGRTDAPRPAPPPRMALTGLWPTENPLPRLCQSDGIHY
jgi:hypothetical protein